MHLLIMKSVYGIFSIVLAFTLKLNFEIILSISFKSLFFINFFLIEIYWGVLIRVEKALGT